MNDSAFNQFNALLQIRYATYSSAWDRAREEFGEPWDTEFSDVIVRMFGDDPSGWQPAVEGYAKFCTDALRSQIYFERNGQYKASSYSEVAEVCYHNSEFMYKSYLPGMLLTHYVWPHHHKMLRWYRSISNNLKISSFAEVGTGCGLYSKESLRLHPNVHGIGYDISKYSLEFTKQVVEAFGFGDRYTICVQDIIKNPPQESDLVICQEVLEHLENPEEFCKALFKMTRPGGYAYITAAINAGHVDHIYLYRSLDEVLKQIREAGYDIIVSNSELAYLNKPIEITPCLGGALCKRPEE